MLITTRDTQMSPDIHQAPAEQATSPQSFGSVSHPPVSLFSAPTTTTESSPEAAAVISRQPIPQTSSRAASAMILDSVPNSISLNTPSWANLASTASLQISYRASHHLGSSYPRTDRPSSLIRAASSLSSRMSRAVSWSSKSSAFRWCSSWLTHQ
jgi:hypothetical protein